MHPGELLDLLRDLAREAGIEVREIPGAAGEGDPVASGTCRVKGDIWVLLSAADSPNERIAVLARALAEHAPRDLLESRYLPPAVRACLGSDFDPA